MPRPNVDVPGARRPQPRKVGDGRRRRHRRNLTTSGVPLNYLVGKTFQIGEVILKGGRLNFPCKYLADLLQKPLVLPLYNRSGLNCSVEKGGIIKKGDKIIQVED